MLIRLDGYLWCQFTETKVCGQTCRPTRTHYTDFEPTSLCSFSFMLHVQRETTHTNLIVFGLTRSGLEPTIYHTGGGRKDFICQMTMKCNCKQSNDYMKTKGRYMQLYKQWNKIFILKLFVYVYCYIIVLYVIISINFSGQQKQNSSLKIVFSYNILPHSKFSKFSESYLALNILNEPVLITIN